MSLYARYHKPSFGKRENIRIKTGTSGLSFIVADNPLSEHFIVPKSSSSSEIWNYLVAVQIRQYGKAVELGTDTRTITRMHIKQALKKHSAEFVYRAIRYSAQISRFPYSIPFAIKAFENVGQKFDQFGRDQKSNIVSDCSQSFFDYTKQRGQDSLFVP